MLAFFWGGGTGSEVLSTQEMRSKHPQTSLQTQGGEAGFSFDRTVGPGLRKHKVQPRVGRGKAAPLVPSVREGAVSALDKGPGTSPHLGSRENRTKPGCGSQHCSSRGPCLLQPWLAALFQQCPATQLGTRLCSLS